MPAGSVKGGDKLAGVLQKTAATLASDRVLRVGFLEGATYPRVENTADRLLKGLDKLNRVGPFARRAKAPAVGPAALTKGAAPSSLRQYRANSKKNFVGPRDQPLIYVAQVAAWQNFGSARVRKRPFFTNVVEKGRTAWGPLLGKAVQQTKNGDKALTLLGEYIQGQIVKAIVDWPADNAPLTVAIKGFNKGLVDKGIMQRNVAFELKS